MTSADQYVEQAIPHEAGHVLVGRTLGVLVHRLEHIVVCGPNKKLFPGDFVTKSVSPDPFIVPFTPSNVLKAYVCMVGGGLAGNVISNVAPDQYGLEKDRADLLVVSTITLEEAAQAARKIIDGKLDMFGKLKAAIRDRLASLMKNPQIAAGCYTLLSNDQLEKICPQNKKLFPPEAYL